MIHYHTSTTIWLHLEDYYNLGMTPDEAKTIIEKIRDPYGSSYFYCESSGFNGNWNINTRAKHPDDIKYIILCIETELCFNSTKTLTSNTKEIQ